METGSLLLIISLLIISVFIIIRPILKRHLIKDFEPATSQIDHRLSALLAERDRLLTLLKELDFDNALGKIPETEYPRQRNALMLNGIEILKQIDDTTHKSGGAHLVQHREKELLDSPQQNHSPVQIGNNNGMSHTNSVGVAVISNSEDELEIIISDRRRSRGGRADGFCPNCGAVHQMKDLFCPRCGVRIE